MRLFKKMSADYLVGNWQCQLRFFPEIPLYDILLNIEVNQKSS